MAWWDDEVVNPDATGDDPYAMLAGQGSVPDPWNVATAELEAVVA